MPPKDSSRESHFPAIEKKYGESMKFWFAVMKKVEGKKYPSQGCFASAVGYAPWGLGPRVLGPDSKPMA